MAQTWTDDVYDPTHIAATDLQNMENNFAALKSGFSGSSAPSGAVGGQVWHRSTARKVRNYANSAWLISLLGDASQKMWVYRNDTCEGWLIDTSVADAALAIKGGTLGFNVNGGNVGGSWTVGGLTNGAHYHSHVHQWFKVNSASASDQSHNSSGTLTSITKNASSKQSGAITLRTEGYSETNPAYGPGADMYTGDGGTSASGTAAVTSAATWRPRAAVGTLQYPDVT